MNYSHAHYLLCSTSDCVGQEGSSGLADLPGFLPKNTCFCIGQLQTRKLVTSEVGQYFNVQDSGTGLNVCVSSKR